MFLSVFEGGVRVFFRFCFYAEVFRSRTDVGAADRWGFCPRAAVGAAGRRVFWTRPGTLFKSAGNGLVRLTAICYFQLALSSFALNQNYFVEQGRTKL